MLRLMDIAIEQLERRRRARAFLCFGMFEASTEKFTGGPLCYGVSDCIFRASASNERVR
jgi:hypothetical protein